MSSLDDSLKNIINELKAQKDALNQKHNKLIDAENDLRVEIRNAAKILEDKKNEQQVISDSTLIKQQKVRNEELKKEISNLQTEEEKYKQNLSDLRKKVTNINNILANTLQDYKVKKAELDKFKSEEPLIHKQIEEITYKLNNIEEAQNKVESLEDEYKKLNSVRNTVIVKFDATVELLNNMEESNNINFNKAKSIYNRVESFITVLKDGK
ncbi:MAG: hypothetical protein IKO19_03980 [Candidatus Riflebacteria bacterium]|nr:hypothetical protein [Candidatus Riflebacteria bacterium]